MKKLNQMTLLCTAAVLMNSCGIITKTRYGNGLKLNFGERFYKSEKSISKSDKKVQKYIKPVLDTAHLSHSKDSNYSLSTSQINKNAVLPIQPIFNRNHVIFRAKPISLPPTGTVCKMEKTKRHNNAEDRPFEPHVRTGAYLFYSSILAYFFLPIAGTFIGMVFTAFFLAGFVLAIIGLNKIKRSCNYYEGRGLAVSIVVVYFVFLLLALMSLLSLLVLLMLL